MPIKINFNNDIERVLEFVNVCQSYHNDDIDVFAGRYIVDGKSQMGVTAICTLPDISVKINTDSPTNEILFAEDMKRFE